MTRVAAYKASFSEKMWVIIKEIGSDPEKKEIGKILYPLGIRPKPEKSVSSTDPMKWEQVEKLYPELTRKAHEQYKKDEDVRCTKDPKKVRNPVTLENFSKSDVIEEHVKQMPPQLTTKKYGKKNGGRTEQTILKERMVYNEETFYEVPFDKETGSNQLEEVAVKNKNSLFGKNIIYTGVKTLQRSRADIKTIPDGYVIVLNEKNNSNLWFIEYEYHKHDAHSHILNQLSRFEDVFRNTDTKIKIRDEFYQKIKQDDEISKKIKSIIGEGEILNFLEKIINNQLQIKIVIDEYGEKLREVIKYHILETKIQVIELRKFENKDGKQIISLKEFSR